MTQSPVQHRTIEGLERFIGTWQVDGHAGEGAPGAAGARMTGIESYEWLPGGYFLVNRWDRRVGPFQHTGMGIIGQDDASTECSTQSFDNMGFARRYRTTVEDGVMTLSGTWERARIAVSEDGAALSIHWERSLDGESWLPLCDLTGTRVASGGA